MEKAILWGTPVIFPGVKNRSEFLIIFIIQKWSHVREVKSQLPWHKCLTQGRLGRHTLIKFVKNSKTKIWQESKNLLWRLFKQKKVYGKLVKNGFAKIGCRLNLRQDTKNELLLIEKSILKRLEELHLLDQRFPEKPIFPWKNSKMLLIENNV